MDLAVWLGLRLDEDEKTAAGLRSMVTSLNEMNDRLPLDSRRGTQVYDAGLWALTRLLAEIAAKRKLLALHGMCDSGYGPCEETGIVTPCVAQRLLAAPCADRAGFDLAWKIDD